MLSTALALFLATPSLVLDTGAKVTLSREALLARADVQSIHVESPDFGGPADLKALPLASLLDSAGDQGSLQVTCADGFVAELPLAEALQTAPQKPIAYLAIDDGTAPWKASAPAPGPFAVVWTVPKGQTVARERWPNQVVALAAVSPLLTRYSKLAPSGGAAERRGLQVFATHCLPCHSLNAQGPSTLGPDLNLPQSPVDYLGKARLRAFVRDPQSLHRWPNARMPSFAPSTLSDRDLDDLLAYLAERAKHR